MEHQILLVSFIVYDWPAKYVMFGWAGLGSFHSDHLGFNSNEYRHSSIYVVNVGTQK